MRVPQKEEFQEKQLGSEENIINAEKTTKAKKAGGAVAFRYFPLKWCKKY